MTEGCATGERSADMAVPTRQNLDRAEIAERQGGADQAGIEATVAGNVDGAGIVDRAGGAAKEAIAVDDPGRARGVVERRCRNKDGWRQQHVARDRSATAVVDDAAAGIAGDRAAVDTDRHAQPARQHARRHRSGIVEGRGIGAEIVDLDDGAAWCPESRDRAGVGYRDGAVPGRVSGQPSTGVAGPRADVDAVAGRRRHRSAVGDRDVAATLRIGIHPACCTGDRRTRLDCRAEIAGSEIVKVDTGTRRGNDSGVIVHEDVAGDTGVDAAGSAIVARVDTGRRKTAEAGIDDAARCAGAEQGDGNLARRARTRCLVSGVDAEAAGIDGITGRHVDRDIAGVVLTDVDARSVDSRAGCDRRVGQNIDGDAAGTARACAVGGPVEAVLHAGNERSGLVCYADAAIAEVIGVDTPPIVGRDIGEIIDRDRAVDGSVGGPVVRPISCGDFLISVRLPVRDESRREWCRKRSRSRSMPPGWGPRLPG